MNELRVIRLNRYAMAALLLTCLILGGGTEPSLAIDSVLLAAMIFVAVLVFLTLPDKAIDRRITCFAIFSLAAIVLQLVPLPSPWLNGSQGILPDGAPILGQVGLRIATLVPGRTLECLTWLIAHNLLLLAMLRLPTAELVGLIPFFLLGVCFNLLIAFFQFMSRGGVELDMFTGVSAAAGFFANPNHFSTLAIISVPLAMLFFLREGRWLLLGAFLAFLSLVLLAAVSRFGVVGASIALIGSGLLVLSRRRMPFVFAAGSVIVLIVVVYGAATRLASEGIEPGDRGEITQTTLTAIGDNLPFGIGYGGFVTAYPAYERIGTISHAYINHAHNDFLELALEGGAVAIAVMSLAIALLLSRAFETRWSPFHRGVFLAIGLVLVHSTVDYPLRTIAVSISFVMLLSLLFETSANRKRPNDLGSDKINQQSSDRSLIEIA